MCWIPRHATRPVQRGIALLLDHSRAVKRRTPGSEQQPRGTARGTDCIVQCVRQVADGGQRGRRGRGGTHLHMLLAGWGPKGRWFKSSRPDRHRRGCRGVNGQAPPCKSPSWCHARGRAGGERHFHRLSRRHKIRATALPHAAARTATRPTAYTSDPLDNEGRPGVLRWMRRRHGRNWASLSYMVRDDVWLAAVPWNADGGMFDFLCVGCHGSWPAPCREAPRSA